MIEKIIVNILELLLVMIVGLLQSKDLQAIQEALSSHDMLFEEKYILSTPRL